MALVTRALQTPLCSRHDDCAPSALLRPTRFVSARHLSAVIHLRPAASPPFHSRSWTLNAVSGGGGVTGGGSGGSSSGGGGGSGGSGDASQPHPMRLWTLLYAALLAGGGIMAYVKKGSTQSLTSALGAALILALSARTMLGAQAKGSLAVCLAIAVLLSVLMSGRYNRTKKMMPAGMTAGVSLAMSAAYLGFLFQ